MKQKIIMLVVLLFGFSLLSSAFAQEALSESSDGTNTAIAENAMKDRKSVV